MFHSYHCRQEEPCRRKYSRGGNEFAIVSGFACIHAGLFVPRREHHVHRVLCIARVVLFHDRYQKLCYNAQAMCYQHNNLRDNGTLHLDLRSTWLGNHQQQHDVPCHVQRRGVRHHQVFAGLDAKIQEIYARADAFRVQYFRSSVFLLAFHVLHTNTVGIGDHFIDLHRYRFFPLLPVDRHLPLEAKQGGVEDRVVALDVLPHREFLHNFQGCSWRRHHRRAEFLLDRQHQRLGHHHARHGYGNVPSHYPTQDQEVLLPVYVRGLGRKPAYRRLGEPELVPDQRGDIGNRVLALQYGVDLAPVVQAQGMESAGNCLVILDRVQRDVLVHVPGRAARAARIHTAHRAHLGRRARLGLRIYSIHPWKALGHHLVDDKLAQRHVHLDIFHLLPDYSASAHFYKHRLHRHRVQHVLVKVFPREPEDYACCHSVDLDGELVITCIRQHRDIPGSIVACHVLRDRRFRGHILHAQSLSRYFPRQQAYSVDDTWYRHLLVR